MMSHEVFEPKTFYDLAMYVKDHLLNTIPRELKQATNRTCISRTYYAIFLSLREKILTLPIRDVELRNRIERTNDAHAIVAESIKKVDFHVGNYIINLRTKRNYADYRTDVKITLEDVMYVLKIANEIFDELMTIVSRLKESDILSAWNKIKEGRKKHLS
jgi:uncharacterized protein (UPF0332 family)